MVLLALACNDQNVGVYNTPPSVQITAPADGDVVLPDELLELVGKATDDQQSPDTLVVTWTSSLDGLLGDSVADVDGIVVLPVTELSVGTHAITLAALDDQNQGAQETITIDVGYGSGSGNPIVTLIGPTDGEQYERSEGVQVVGTATDSEQSWDTLQASIISSRDGVLWEGAPEPNGAVSVNTNDVFGTLSVGDTTISLVVLDDDGNTGTAEAFIEVVDDAVPSVVVWSPTVSYTHLRAHET